MQLSDFLTVDHVLAEMQSTNKKEAIEELGELISKGCSSELKDAIIKVLMERESISTTAIGETIAIPHGKLDRVETLLFGIGRSKSGLDFQSVDGQPTKLFFILFAPEESTMLHLKALARISRLCKDTNFRQKLLDASNANEMYEIFRKEDQIKEDQIRSRS